MMGSLFHPNQPLKTVPDLNEIPIHMVETCCDSFEDASNHDFITIRYHLQKKVLYIESLDGKFDNKKMMEVTFCPFCGQKFQMHYDKNMKVKRKNKLSVMENLND